MKLENGFFVLDTSDKSFEWFNYTSDTSTLINKVYGFTDVFSDMLFRKDSITEKMVKCQFDWGDHIIDLPFALSCFDYFMFRFSVESLEECDGRYEMWEQRLIISPDQLNNDSIILHEMIHLHESLLMTLPIFFHEAVIYCLYTDLLAKIPNLNSIIEDCTHLYNCMLMAEEGGLHDMLFLLKSFDIDLRFDWPLGTTYGYDMKDRIEHYLKEGK